MFTLSLRRKIVFIPVAFLTFLLFFRLFTQDSADADLPPVQLGPNHGDVLADDSDKTLTPESTLKAPIERPSSIFSFSSQPKKPVSPGDLFTHILNSNPPPGYVVFSRLYLFEGTLYAVVRDEESKQGYPPLKYILSRPLRMEISPNDPTDSVCKQIIETLTFNSLHQKEMQILTEEEAISIFGPLNEAISIEGVSFILHEQPQFMTVRRDIFLPSCIHTLFIIALLPLVG